jgi:hypothetical protein
VKPSSLADAHGKQHEHQQCGRTLRERDVTLTLFLAADKDLIMKQMNILRLYRNTHQRNLFKDQVELGNTYDIEAHITNYKVRRTKQPR